MQQLFSFGGVDDYKTKALKSVMFTLTKSQVTNYLVSANSPIYSA